MKPKFTKKEILDFFYSLSLEEVIKIVKDYDKKHKVHIAEELEKLQLSEVERKLLEAGVNSTCPYCGSDKIVKRGRDVNFQRYLCKDCQKSFTAVTNTFLENTNFPWKVWVKIMEMTIHNESIADMVNQLEVDYGYLGLTDITVLLARHKILYAVSLLPQPVLTGVIQIDETFFRESQKAAKELVNYIPSVAEYRKPRYGVQPSLLGTMGSEFSNVPVAIDSSGHMVAKVACLGRLTIEIFTDLFHEHIDKPAYICTVANPIYKRYCKLFGIPHYIRPSTYYTDIKKAGYDQPYSLLEYLDDSGDSIGIAIVPLSCASKSEDGKMRAKIMEKHTLLAVITMPNQLFADSKVSTQTCIMIFKAHVPHNYNKKVFLGRWKDDGYIVVPHNGRIDRDGKYDGIKAEWFKELSNEAERDNTKYMWKNLDKTDEWLAEAYLETDYSTLTDKDFETVLKKYALFKYMSEKGMIGGGEDEEN